MICANFTGRTILQSEGNRTQCEGTRRGMDQFLNKLSLDITTYTDALMQEEFNEGTKYVPSTVLVSTKDKKKL